MSKKKGQKIRIYFKDGRRDVIRQRFWDDYEVNHRLFIVKRKGSWVAIYQMDEISCVVVG